MKKYVGCTSSHVAWWLVLIGALNWGLVGVFNWNLVEWLFGNWDWLVRLVYILVGLSAVASLWGCRCKKCSAK